MKRLVAFAALAGVLVLGLTQPVAAAPKSVIRSAAAFWELGDPLATSVSLQPTSSKSHLEPGKPMRTREIFLFVTQGFCDTGADQHVFRSFSAVVALQPNEVHVQPNLKRARVDARVVLSGSETRFDDCSVEPTGVGGTFVDLGTAPARITATWDVVGPVQQAGEGFVTREAVATGTLTSPSSAGVGSLGPSDFASIMQFTT